MSVFPDLFLRLPLEMLGHFPGLQHQGKGKVLGVVELL
jgi:hypothetical protein